MASNDTPADQNFSILRDRHSFPSQPLRQNRRERPSRVKNLEHSSSSSGIRDRYKSAFTEVGLDGVAGATNCDPQNVTPTRLGSRIRWRSEVEIHEAEKQEEGDTAPEVSRAAPAITWHPHRSSAALLTRLSFMIAVLAILAPILHMSPLWHAGPASLGAEAGPIDPRSIRPSDVDSTKLLPRHSNAADICLRWSQQSAVVNGTLYLYGGRAKDDSNQGSNQWNNNFLTLDLTSGWEISSPTLKSLPQPSGPPPVSNGFLWNSHDTLYLYGGEYSDNPEASPVPYSLWSYNIPSSEWQEQSDPKTVDNVPIERSAEGSGVNIPSLGRGMYFGGHVDRFTTSVWDISIPRVYLRSLLEFIFPGSSDPAVHNNQPAGSDGVWRNITDGGIQESAGFTERADGVLVYVPGYGEQGILLGLAGGTNKTYTQMNVIDVYDIAGQTWYKQATSGPSPDLRVNPCAVATSAADGSSVQVHLFAGQKLLPYGNQEQFDDMWILSIPSFTWIQVDTSGQSVPPGRSGHTCNVWNSQMIVVGGYVGEDLSCDSPGVYVFNTSSLKWNTKYAALKGANDVNQQMAQEKDTSALQGSYGYVVPDAVREVIGGNEMGSATITAPAQTVTAGPFATGKPVTYTVTQGDGSTATETASPGTGFSGTANNKRGPNIAAIVAGVIAGPFAILAAYLGFCAWIYRRQLALYKRHVAMSQRQSLGITAPMALGIGAPGKGHDSPLGKESLDATSASSSSNARTAVSQGTRQTGGGYQQVPMALSNNFAGGLDSLSTKSAKGGLGTANSSTDDLLEGQEPTFLGVLLSPRRSLRVINRD